MAAVRAANVALTSQHCSSPIMEHSMGGCQNQRNFSKPSPLHSQGLKFITALTFVFRKHIWRVVTGCSTVRERKHPPSKVCPRICDTKQEMTTLRLSYLHSAAQYNVLTEAQLAGILDTRVSADNDWNYEQWLVSDDVTCPDHVGILCAVR